MQPGGPSIHQVGALTIAIGSFSASMIAASRLLVRSAMRHLIVGAAAVLVACSAESTGSSGAKASGDDIASIALAELGGHACYPQVFGSSCSGNGGSPEYWCADFAKWVWQQAGADTSGLTAAAGSFYVYGQNHGTLHQYPSVGDAVVFDYAGGGYADHVALVTKVNGNGTIEAVSGDWGGSGVSEAAFSSTSVVALNAPAFSSAVGGTPSVIGMTISGYISPAGGGGGGGCEGYQDGLYCGGDYVSGDPSTLYRCSGGSLSPVEQCASGCQVMPSGMDDQCAAAPPPPQDNGCSGYQDGLYCGGDYIQGDPGTLYRCSGGSLSVEQSCDNGCQSMPSGQDDLCAPPASACAGYNDGLYCGGDYIQGDASTLYRCTGGSLSVEQVCASGCEVMANGTNDRCY